MTSTIEQAIYDEHREAITSRREGRYSGKADTAHSDGTVTLHTEALGKVTVDWSIYVRQLLQVESDELAATLAPEIDARDTPGAEGIEDRAHYVLRDQCRQAMVLFHADSDEAAEREANWLLRARWFGDFGMAQQVWDTLLIKPLTLSRVYFADATCMALAELPTPTPVIGPTLHPETPIASRHRRWDRLDGEVPARPEPSERTGLSDHAWRRPVELEQPSPSNAGDGVAVKDLCICTGWTRTISSQSPTSVAGPMQTVSYRPPSHTDLKRAAEVYYAEAGGFDAFDLEVILDRQTYGEDLDALANHLDGDGFRVHTQNTVGDDETAIRILDIDTDLPGVTQAIEEQLAALVAHDFLSYLAAIQQQ